MYLSLLFQPFHPVLSLFSLSPSMELHKANLEAQSQAAATAAAILSSSSVNSNINNHPAMAAAALSASATTSTPAHTPTFSQPASMTHATSETTDGRQNAFQLWALQQQQQQQQLATSPYFLPTKVQLQHQPVMATSVAAASPIFSPAAPGQQAGGIPASLLGISSAVSPSVPAPVSTSAGSSSLYHVTPKLKGSSSSTGMLAPSATPSSMAAVNCHRGTDKFAPY